MNNGHKSYDRLAQSVLIIFFAFLLSSCSLWKKDSKEKKTELVDSVEVTLKTSIDINPNEKGIANPVRIVIYQLKRSERFNTSDYFTLADESDPDLNADIRKFYDTIMVPGEEKTINVPTDKDITALGFVAAYRDITQSKWKKNFLLPEKPKEKWYERFWPGENIHHEKITVNIERLTTSIKSMD